MGIIKLANPLPRITLPSKLANGNAAVPWTKDPYLDTTVSGAPWVIANSNVGSAKQFKDRGAEYACSIPYQGLMNQDVAFMNAARGYIEVIDINGCLLIDIGGGQEKIYSPGNYLLSWNGGGTQPYIYSESASFIDDPYFKSIPYGLLGNADTLQKWGIYAAPITTKGSDGRLYMNLIGGGAEGFTWWDATWSGPSVICDVELIIDYLPPGASISLVFIGGQIPITSAGTYKARVNLAGTVAIWAGTAVKGTAIFSKFFVKPVTQSWFVEGNQRYKINAAWFADAYYFDRIFNPQTIHMATSFERPNMQGWNPLAGEPILGYGQAPPPSGYFRVGDTIRNNCAIAGSVSGWRCTAAGNPGTWMPLASL